LRSSAFNLGPPRPLASELFFITIFGSQVASKLSIHSSKATIAIKLCVSKMSTKLIVIKFITMDNLMNGY